MNIRNSWVTLSILLSLVFMDLVLLAGYLALIGLSYQKARAGNLEYYVYLVADTIFAFILALILTLTGIVFVMHERLVKAPRKGILREDIEMMKLNSNQYLSIDFIPSDDTVIQDSEDTGAPVVTTNHQGAQAKFILHDTPFLSQDQMENAPALKLSGEGTQIKPSRFTIKDNPDTDITYKPFVFKQLSPLTILSCVAMYGSFILLLLGLTSFAWAIVIAQYYRALSYKIGWTFAFVDFMSGILAPFLLLCSITIATFVLSYFTRQEISLRSAISPLLNSVHLLKHSDGSVYWLVGGRFKYNLLYGKYMRNLNNKHPWIESHYSTWAFWVVICIALMFSFSQFINLTVISERTSTTCITDFDCFLAIHPFTFEHIICPAGGNGTFDITFMRNNSVARLPNDTALYCFQYLNFGFDSNLFLALGSTFALYLFGIALFYRIFNATAIFIQIKNTRLWSLPLFIIGFVCILFVIVLYLLNGLHLFLFNIIQFFGILQLSVYFMVIGVLVLAYFHQDEVKKNV